MAWLQDTASTQFIPISKSTSGYHKRLNYWNFSNIPYFELGLALGLDVVAKTAWRGEEKTIPL